MIHLGYQLNSGVVVADAIKDIRIRARGVDKPPMHKRNPDMFEQFEFTSVRRRA
jgi:hypothetical protein